MTGLAFHRLTADELRTAYAWYFARDKDVALQFLKVLEKAVARISADPDSYAIDRKHFRRVRVHRFPYSLIFEHLQPGRVLIVAVAHDRRRPGYWIRRKSG